MGCLRKGKSPPVIQEKLKTKMKILVVNNNTRHIKPLSNALAGHELEIVEYQPGVKFNCQGKDLVVLSGGGGEGREAVDIYTDGRHWYSDEMDFILTSPVPILGICMGFELICQAYGSRVEKMHTSVKRVKTIKAGSKKLQQFNYHNWRISSVSNKHLEVLADSTTGIEMVRHKSRPILATQFHPELGGTLSLPSLIYGRNKAARQLTT